MAAGWIAPAIIAGGTLAAGYFANRSQRQAEEERLRAQEEENEENRLFTEQQHLRQTALAESGMDPWRHVSDQFGTMGRLDAMANYQPRTVTVPAGMEAYTPTVRGGMTMSPELQGWALSARNQVAAGGGRVPTMTNPANYGRTGGFSFGEGGTVSDLGQGAAPGAANTALGTGMPEGVTDPFVGDYLEGYERRNEGAGGVGKGALTGASIGSMGMNPLTIAGGAVIGGIVGAFTKNAPTAATDVSIADAREVVARMYQRELGRAPTPQEVDQQIMNIGWQQGDQWVGERGLMAILENMRSGPEAQGRSANA